MAKTDIIDTINKVTEEVVLKGWVHNRRNMGKLIFIDLRDKTGICQVVFLPNHKEAVLEADKLGLEYVVEIKGHVNQRPEKQVNKDLATGIVEIEALELKILNFAVTTPFEIEDQFKGEVNEELRLKYRYLDLRRNRMKNNIILRHEVVKFMREYFYNLDFTEIETPFLSKSTPEGARDFLVPARNFPGKFYALPQSPQQYKQMLMVAGMEKYFQVVRCFRDEDARGDRQLEFTQLDVEKSFTNQEEILSLIETMLIELVKKVSPDKKITSTPFPRITYAESMDKHKSDRPDLRKNKEDKNELAFCWVTDFPMFEKKDDGSYGATHHPFTAMQPDDISKLKDRKFDDIKAQQYDLALNGNEIFGGSIRTHDPEVLSEVFQALGHSEQEVQEKFGHLLEAFKYGVPPHGGIACGLDRLVMVLAGEDSIRDVIPFPKTLEGRDPLMDSPSEVDQAQLDELNIKIIMTEPITPVAPRQRLSQELPPKQQDPKKEKPRPAEPVVQPGVVVDLSQDATTHDSEVLAARQEFEVGQVYAGVIKVTGAARRERGQVVVPYEQVNNVKFGAENTMSVEDIRELITLAESTNKDE